MNRCLLMISFFSLILTANAEASKNFDECSAEAQKQTGAAGQYQLATNCIDHYKTDFHSCGTLAISQPVDAGVYLLSRSCIEKYRGTVSLKECFELADAQRLSSSRYILARLCTEKDL